LASVADGTSQTYLIGEKHIDSSHYYSGESPGDNVSMYAGYGNDLHRVAGIIERLDLGKSPYVSPLPDQDHGGSEIPGFVRFGSAHVAGVYMSFCDGSVRLITFEVDGEVHFRSAHRRDRGRALEALR
jgi:hypothetical protein